MPKPILAIDIDGVLNRLTLPVEGEQSTWETRSVEVLLADVPHSPFHRRQDHDVPDWPVVVNPRLHAPWLQAMSKAGVEIVWATTWERQANKCFAPFYGLGDWPVACSTVTTPPEYGEDTPDWKARCLAAYAHDRPLIWLDDMNYDYAHLTQDSERDNAQAWAEHNDPAYMGWKPDDGPWGLESYWGLQFGHAAIYVNPEMGITQTVMDQVNVLIEVWTS